MSTLENLISDIGGCGRFQVYQILAINCLRVLSAWGISFMAFGNYNPGWKCTRGGNTTSWEDAGDPGVNATWCGADRGRPSWRPSTGNGHHVRNGERWNLSTYGDDTMTTIMSLPLLNSSTNIDADVSTQGADDSHADTTAGTAYDTKDCRGFSSCPALEFNPDSNTIVSEWGLACDRTWIVSLIISIQMAGFFIGCTLAGQLSERFGRRASLYGNSAVYSVASLLAVFSSSWPMYAACLFVIGMGAGGVLTVALVYSFEFLEPRWRGILGGLPLMNLSMTIFSLIIFLERDWRHVHITMAVLSTVALLPVFWVPESMRWLAVKGRITEAKDVVRKIASTNGSGVSDKDALDILFSVNDDDQGNAEKVRKYTYLDLFRDKRLRWITVKLAMGWTCEVTVYYALSFSVKAFSGNFYLNFFIYSVLEIPVVLLVGPLANRWGRRRCCTGFFFLASCACVAIVIVKLAAESETQSTRAILVLILATTAKSAISGGRSVVTILTGELAPTVVRNLCYAFCMLFSRIGTMIAPYLVPERDTFHISFSIMAALMLLTSLIFVSLPETNDKPMTDTMTTRHETTAGSNSKEGISGSQSV